MLLAGCPAEEVIIDPPPIGAGSECDELNPLPQPHLRQRDCYYRIYLKVGELIGLPGYGNADFSELTADLSGSSVEIASSSGWARLSLKLADGRTVARSFQWVRTGDLLKFAAPSTVENWFNQYSLVVDEASVVADDIRVTEHSSANLYVTETYYDSTFVTGMSESWYSSSGGCEGVFPEPQLCY